MKTNFTEEQIDQITRDYVAGASLIDLARKHHRTQKTIKLALGSRSVPVRPAGRNPRHPDGVIAETYKREGSIRATARALNMSPAGSAYRLMKANLLPPRHAPGRAEVLARYVKKGAPGVCWIAEGPVAGRGYIRVTVGRERLTLHRVAWEVHHGQKIPEGMVISHRCDRPPCCNPLHLRLTTPRGNTAEMVVRGRCHSKLTPGDVLRIRALADADEPVDQIAERFPNVSARHVGRVARRQVWKSL